MKQGELVSRVHGGPCPGGAAETYRGALCFTDLQQSRERNPLERVWGWVGRGFPRG